MDPDGEVPGSPAEGPALDAGAAPDAPRARRRWPWMVLGACGLAMLALVAAFAYDAWRITAAADGLTAHAGAARDALGAGDVTALRDEVAQVEDSARTFEDATHGPHWSLASSVPWVRDQAAPLMAAGTAVGALAEEALAPLAALDSLDALDGDVFAGGRIDPYVLEPARATLATASSALGRERQALAAVDLSSTVPAVATPFRDLEGQVATLADLVDGASLAAELLPTMLGGEGERRYLVMAQNNAEPRATGGIAGVSFELLVEDGEMRIGEFVTANDLVDSTAATPLTEDEERIFTDRMAVYPQSANFTPEFPRTAEILTSQWQVRKGGGGFDGVLSIDPVALGWMLEGSPPLEVDGITVTAEGLAPLLLNESYFRFPDPSEQDAFFARVSSALFAQVLGGGAPHVDGIEQAIDAGRLMVWSAHADEQALLAAAPIGGEFLGRDDALGVFVNEGSGAKIGYYVEPEVTVTDTVCTDGTLAAQTVEVTYTHAFGGDVADLPSHLTGDGEFAPIGEFHANVLFYPAAGTTVVGVTRDGEPTDVVADVHGGRDMSQRRIELAPGESTTLVYTLEPTGRIVPPDAVMTPGPRDVTPLRVTEAAPGC